jgi:hypothetical protein
MKNLFFILFIAMFLSGCDGCGPQESYPDIPSLEFKKLVFGNDGDIKTFTLLATFKDGDGDVGYYLDRPNDPIFDDTISEYYYNYVIALQVQKNGIWKDTTIFYENIEFNSDTTETDNDTIITYYNDLASGRLPYLTPEEQNKGLKCDIEKTAWLPFLHNDSIRFKAFIYDRALHKSNEIFTPGYFAD